MFPLTILYENGGSKFWRWRFFARSGELYTQPKLHPALLRLSAMVSQSFTGTAVVY